MVLQRAHFLDEQTKARGYGWTGYVGVGGVCVSAASSVTQQGWWGRGPVHPHPCALLACVTLSAEPPMCAVNQGPAPVQSLPYSDLPLYKSWKKTFPELLNLSAISNEGKEGGREVPGPGPALSPSEV